MNVSSAESTIPDAPSGGNDPASEPAFAAQAKRMKFCDRCGASRSGDSGACAFCEARAVASTLPATQPADGAGIVASLALYGALLAISIVALAWSLLTERDIGLTGELWMTGVFTLLTLGFVLWHRADLVPLLRRRGSIRWYGMAIAMSFGTFLLASLFIKLLTLIGLEELRYSDSYLDELGAGWGWVILLLSIVAQPAVMEELAFRGVILGSLRKQLSLTEAAVVSSAMFAFLHLAVPSFPHLLILGLLLAFLTIKSGSIYPAMLLHACHNALVVLTEQLWYTGIDVGL